MNKKKKKMKKKNKKKKKKKEKRKIEKKNGDFRVKRTRIRSFEWMKTTKKKKRRYHSLSVIAYKNPNSTSRAFSPRPSEVGVPTYSHSIVLFKMCFGYENQVWF